MARKKLQVQSPSDIKAKKEEAATPPIKAIPGKPPLTLKENRAVTALADSGGLDTLVAARKGGYACHAGQKQATQIFKRIDDKLGGRLTDLCTNLDVTLLRVARILNGALEAEKVAFTTIRKHRKSGKKTIIDEKVEKVRLGPDWRTRLMAIKLLRELQPEMFAARDPDGETVGQKTEYDMLEEEAATGGTDDIAAMRREQMKLEEAEQDAGNG